MKLYFDICALKRPFDNRSQARVDAEAIAVLELLARVEAGEHQLVWSDALTFENDADPDQEAREAVSQVERLAAGRLASTAEIQQRTRALCSKGLGTLDAAHAAFAESAACDCLVTCDDRFIRRAARIRLSVRVVNPIELVREIEDGAASERQ